VKSQLILLGLPSTALEFLASHLNVRYVEIPEIREVWDGSPNEHGVLSEEWISSKLAESIGDARRGPVLLVYTSPATFLAHRLKRGAETQLAPEDLEPIATESLEFWRAYHRAILEQYREHEDRALLVNGDHEIDFEALRSRMKELFVSRDIPQRTTKSVPGILRADLPSATLLQIVDAYSPECLELYAELESCAELMGREPEFEFTGLAMRQTRARELLQLIAGREQIEHVLAKRHMDSIEEYEAEARTLLEEKERLLNQLRDTQQQLDDRRLLHQKMEEQLAGIRAKDAEEHAERESEKASISREREDAQRRLEQLDEQVAVLVAERNSLKSENELLLLQLQQVQEELERYFLLYQKIEQQQGQKRKASDVPSMPAENESGGRGRNSEAARQPGATSLLQTAVTLLGSVQRRRKSLRHAQLIRQSGYFDDTWYLKQYPEVAEAGLDPAEHYLKVGSSEGRNPGPNFDTRWYLECNPDVVAANINPLLHFIKFGRSEGRQPMRYRT